MNRLSAMSWTRPDRRRAGRGPVLPRPEPAPGPEYEIEAPLSWAEVNLTHKVQNGVYHRYGRLISLLTDFGRINPCYPDRHGSSSTAIQYVGEGRRGDQRLSPGNRALLSAIESSHAVPLFNKLAVGRWQHMGYWRVVDGKHVFHEKERRMLWQFSLQRASTTRIDCPERQIPLKACEDVVRAMETKSK
jgi:hypothetical protein